jgi:hypothetical protein
MQSGVIKPSRTHNDSFAAVPSPLDMYIQIVSNSSKVTQPLTNVKSKDVYNHMCSYLQDNSILFHILTLVDTTVTLKTCHIEKRKELETFQKRLADSLDNECKLFKVLGFSKRKNISLDDMKSRLLSPTTNTSLKRIDFEYLSKLIKKNIVLFKLCDTDWRHHERDDIIIDNNLETLSIDMRCFQVLQNTTTIEGINSVFKSSLTNNDLFQRLDEMKHISKLLGFDTSGLRKPDLLKQLKTLGKIEISST